MHTSHAHYRLPPRSHTRPFPLMHEAVSDSKSSSTCRQKPHGNALHTRGVASSVTEYSAACKRDILTAVAEAARRCHMFPGLPR